MVSLSLMTLMQLSLPTSHTCCIADSCVTVNSVNFRFFSQRGSKWGPTAEKSAGIKFYFLSCVLAHCHCCCLSAMHFSKAEASDRQSFQAFRDTYLLPLFSCANGRLVFLRVLRGILLTAIIWRNICFFLAVV